MLSAQFFKAMCLFTDNYWIVEAGVNQGFTPLKKGIESFHIMKASAKQTTSGTKSGAMMVFLILMSFSGFYQTAKS